MAEDNAFDYSAHFPDAAILAAQDAGRNLRDNPASILPPLAGLGQQPTPEFRDSLVSALQGLRASAAASADAARFGDPFTAALAAIGGAASQPGPQAIAAQRADIQRQQLLRQLESSPVELVSPDLVQAHPELKGMPLAVVERIAPLIEKASAAQDQHYTLDQAAALMAPTKDPKTVNQTKAQLSQLFPKGLVPKDFANTSATNARMELTYGEKQSQFDQKRVTAFGEALDPSKARAGTFGDSQKVVNRAERLQSLANALPNLRSSEIEELAIGLNAMLSGSNTGAAEQVKALVPQSAIGNARKLQEWLTNNPTGTDQQAFVERMLGSVAREKATAEAQIKREQLRRTQRYADLEKSNPDAFYNQLEAYGISPEEYQAWKAGGHKAVEAVHGAKVPAPAAIPTVNDDAEYAALPIGSLYIGPDGVQRRKK
jgi:DNA-binding phage protein